MSLEQIKTLIRIIGFIAAAITALFNLGDEVKYFNKLNKK